MAWTIEYDQRVLKELKKLERSAQRDILDFFDERVAKTSDARSFGKALTSTFSGLWRYRIGNYRAICRIQDQKCTILVLRIAHRKKVYR